MGRVVHFDCFSGISGDMAVGAFLDAGVPIGVIEGALLSLELPGTIAVEKVKKRGFAATQFRVQTPHEHKHRHLSHIRAILERGKLTDRARSIAVKMFEKLGEAEAHSHGIPVEKVHFHEVGAVDSIYDFVAAAVAIDWLDPVRITSSPVAVGSGFVQCEHGRLPVPAPATAFLLRGIPLAECIATGELTTPTGAAILSANVDSFTSNPQLVIEDIGLGAGQKDLPEQPNVLRLLIGRESAFQSSASSDDRDTVWELRTNLDDVSSEIIGYCVDALFAAGALDVFITPIQMKKNRPGVLLTVLCDDQTAPLAESILFKETGTFGVRKSPVARTRLQRRSVEVDTRLGNIRGKLGWANGMQTFSPEFEDCARIAREKQIPLREVYFESIAQFQNQKPTKD